MDHKWWTQLRENWMSAWESCPGTAERLLSAASAVLDAGAAVRDLAKAVREELKARAHCIRTRTTQSAESLRCSAEEKLLLVDECLLASIDTSTVANAALEAYFEVLGSLRRLYDTARLALETLADTSVPGAANETEAPFLQTKLQPALDSFHARLGNLETAFGELAATTRSETPLQPIPWQIKYSAEFDPFPPPSSAGEGSTATGGNPSGGVVEFEGGKITDKDGNDIWEDRCYLTEETIQSGAVGEGSPRYRSLLHRGIVRAPWVHELQVRLRAILKRSSGHPNTESMATQEDDGVVQIARFPAAREEGEVSTASHTEQTLLCSHLHRTVESHDPYFWGSFSLETNHDVFLYLASKAFARKGQGPGNGVTDAAVLCRGMHAAFQLYSNRPLLAVMSSPPTTGSGLLKFESYGSVQEKVLRVANGLRRLLLHRQRSSDAEQMVVPSIGSPSTKPFKGTIGIWLPNCPEWLYLDWACAYSGLTSVGIHDHWPLPDVKEAILRANVGVIFTTQDLLLQLRQAFQPMIPGTKILDQVPVVIGVDLGSPSQATGEPLKRVSDTSAPPLLQRLVEEFWDGCSNAAVNSLQTTTGLSAAAGRLTETESNEGETPPLQTSDVTYSLMFSSGTSGKLKAIPVRASTWYENNAGRSADYHLQPLSVLSYTSLAHGMDRGMCYSALLKGGRITMLLPHRARKTPLHAPSEPGCWDVAHGIAQLVRLTLSMFPVLASRLERRGRVLDRPRIPFPETLRACSQSRVSILPASPDLWHNLWFFLESLGVIELLSYYRDISSSASANQDPNSSQLQQSLHCLCLAIKLLILGPNAVQVATGAAPIDPTMLADLKELFAFSAAPPTGPVPNIATDPPPGACQLGVATLTHAFAAIHATPFVNIYGATEAPGISTDGEISPEYQLRLRILDFCESNNPLPMATADEASPQPLKRSVVLKGELIVKGPSVVQGYYSDEAETNRVFTTDGWYSTGDVVALRRKSNLTPINHGNDDQEASKEEFGVASLGQEGVDFRVLEAEPSTSSGMGTPFDFVIEMVNNPSSKFLLSVVGRANQYLELYVDHRSEWVPAVEAERITLQCLRQIQQQKIPLFEQKIPSSPTQTDVPAHVAETLERAKLAAMHLQVHQICLFSDRMASRLVAVVAASLQQCGATHSLSGEFKSGIEQYLVAEVERLLAGNPPVDNSETLALDLEVEEKRRLTCPPSSWISGSLILDLDGP